MRLTRLVLKDFISYEDLDYMFESKPLLVQGVNLTDDGQKTNGVGKSVIPTAVEQLITGTNSRGVLDSELITYGKNQSIIQLFAECDVRKERIHIENVINLKNSNQFIVKTQQYGSDSWKPADYSTAPEGKKFVSDWFAISKEDLFNYFIINNTRFKSFFKSSNTEKVALINRFSDASIVQGIEVIDLTKLEEEKTGHKTLFDGVLGKIEHVEESIKLEKERDFKTELQEKIEELDEEIDEVEEEISELRQDIKDNNFSKPAYLEKIKTLKEQESVNKASKLSIEKEVKSISKEVEESLKKVEEAKTLVDNFKVVDFKSEKEVFEKSKTAEKLVETTLKTEKEQKEELKKKVLKLANDLEIKLSGVITCPNCSHKFLLDDDLEKLESKQKETLVLKKKVEDILVTKEESIKTVLGKISKIEENISSINTRQSKWNEDKNTLSTSFNSCTESLNKIKAKLSSKEIELKTLKLKEDTRISNIKTEEGKLEKIDTDNSSIENSINLKKEKIELIKTKKQQLKLGDNKEQLAKLNKELEEYKKQLVIHQKNVTESQEKLDNKKEWIVRFKQFRMYLANQSLGVIEYHCNRYLLEMGSDLTIKIEGFKVLADSTIKEEITCKIVRNIERNFNSFSGGERGRLLFASILANRFMINETHPYGGLDFLAIDEVFEGVDSEGLISLIESAKLLSIPVLLITHVSVEEDDNVLTIVKENGVSKIRY